MNRKRLELTLRPRRPVAAVLRWLGFTGALVVLGLLAMPQAAPASSWTVQSVPAPTVPQGVLQAVSCSSTTDCIAVGGFTDSRGSQATLAEHWDGISWAIQTSPRPGGYLYSVSCTAPNACTAVGGQLVERWDGTSWKVQSTPVTGWLNAVSCPSATSCVAVGYVVSGATSTTLVESWDGSSWAVQKTPNPPGANTNQLNAVSCISATSCTSVGYANLSDGFHTLVEHWDGTTWTIQPTPDPGGSVSPQLNGVSCTSTNACIAVGGSFGAGAVDLALVERWDGTSWTIQTTPKPANGKGDLQAISCTSASACTAVGATTERWDGATWTIQGTPSPPGTDIGFLRGVSCPPVAACTAVGDFQTPVGGDMTFAESWDGTWSVQTTPDTGPTSTFLNATSCKSPTACTAVGYFVNAAGNEVPLAEQWDGASWRIQTLPVAAGATATRLLGVSCTASNACIAVGYYEYNGSGQYPMAERWDGTSWTSETPPSPPNTLMRSSSLDSVSCPAATFCRAAGSYYDIVKNVFSFAEHRAAGGWTTESPANPGGTSGDVLNGISCVTDTDCIAVGWGDLGTGPQTLAEHWDGTAWTVERTPNPTWSILQGVSCSSAAACSAVGWSYNSSHLQLPLADVWNGSAWAPQAVAAPPGGAGAAFNGVSCATADTCSAVGNLSGVYIFAERWNGTDWSIQATPGPSPSNLKGVSCPTTTDCVAVGDSQGSVQAPLAEQYAGPPAPVGSGSPVISGAAADGQMLRESHASWTNNPTGYSYRWEDCDNAGSNCSPIAGATSPTYVLTAADIGSTIRVQETASNDGGTGAALSAAQTAVVAAPPLPSNTSPPTISGTATQGQVLTETHGGWTNSPTSFAYQWEACDSSGNACAPIAAAIGQAYTLAATDSGHTIRVREIASNPGGSSLPASSAHTAMVQPLPPSNISPPTLSGAVSEAQRLFEGHGAWTNIPTSFAYEWQDCNSSGNTCSPIAGATGQSYVLVASDVGHTIRVTETASNAGGASAPVSSPASGVVRLPPVTAVKPSSESLPVITGARTVGRSLSASEGTWLGSAPISYTYRWERCIPGCSSIAGATGAAYSLTAAELGSRVRVVVTASNSAGSLSAISAQVGPVDRASPTAAQIKALLVKEITPHGKAAKIAALLHGAGYLLPFEMPTRGQASISWFLTTKGPHRAHRTILIATGHATLANAERLKVKVKLTRSGKQILGHTKHLNLIAKGRFAPSDMPRVVASKPFRLTR